MTVGAAGPSRAGENNGSIDPVTGRNASTSFAQLTFERFRDHHPALADGFAYAPFTQIGLVIDGEPETLPLGQLVSGDYYGALGVSAILGRTLTPADDRPSAAPVAVISHRYWENRFGSDPTVLGKDSDQQSAGGADWGHAALIWVVLGVG